LTFLNNKRFLLLWNRHVVKWWNCLVPLKDVEIYAVISNCNGAGNGPVIERGGDPTPPKRGRITSEEPASSTRKSAHHWWGLRLCWRRHALPVGNFSALSETRECLKDRPFSSTWLSCKVCLMTRSSDSHNVRNGQRWCIPWIVKGWWIRYHINTSITMGLDPFSSQNLTTYNRVNKWRSVRYSYTIWIPLSIALLPHSIYFLALFCWSEMN
jgi:hypothetical protein